MWTRIPSSALRLTGADRVDFVQGQMTNHLKAAPTPGMVPCAFLNVRGQVEFFARAYKRADDVYLHLAEGDAPALAARLRRYIIFDQVDVQDVTEQLGTAHVWPGAALPGWDAAGADVQSFELGGGTVLAARVNRVGAVGVDVHYLRAHEAAVLAALGEEVPGAALERARLEAGVPDVPADEWRGVLPQEVGLDFAISYRKGCYVGQEIMARLEARGNTRYRLARLTGEGLPAHADVTDAAGKVVGRTGASTGAVTLARLRKEFADGADVQVGGVSARVEDLTPAQPG
ncbi:YgfZ/GcvT domain-containing protein [Deinococcus maricopensis]|uniref:Folate-binding protein YgfZ n=1 Tax=Deinococcus maricopensis (strain DSM 21211 / LMG 22137 / NRRL B-23946 / LB-34) TaxID=709986 RepID=E8U5D4_DEIML|nr:folate-binding protein YgfZ [Deinococcus maricopensis]ADV66273.1 folate-binding protein YgfZ [Deinococcus maricopensis DSM 21211]